VLVTKLISSHVTDKAPKGPSAGDRSQERTRLLNAVPQFGKPAGAVVGHDQGTTVLDSKTSGRMTGITYLPGGTLVVHGRVRADRERGGIVAPVTRGTGRYSGARGTIWIVRVRNPNRVLNVYTLKYS
jgi:hypothetical protein